MSGSFHRIVPPAIFAFIFSGHLMAQPLRSADPDADSLTRYVEVKYGLDQGLVSGFQYYVRFPHYKGDPFFPEDAFFEGTVSLRGLQYDEVRLKYNSFTQNLILEYTDSQDGYNLLILNNAHIDSFRLGTHRFQKLSMNEEEPMFYQVISTERLRCYIHWKKDIQSTNSSLQHTHAYTKPKRNYYLDYRESIYPFTNRKSFINIFAGPIQTEINAYIRDQHFSFRKAGPMDIQNLLNFTSQQIDETYNP